MYGENIKILNESSNTYVHVGGIVRVNAQNGIVENIFSLVSLDNVYQKNDAKGNILYSNGGNATVQNIYSVGIGENTDLTKGPNIYSKGSKKVYNNYYFADEIFTSELETKGNKLSLWDAEFQNQIINEDGAFKITELVNEGYYPQLNMPEVMPAQEYIELPEVEDADLPDILSTKIIEQGTNTVKVEFSVNNPSAEQISEIKIENIETEIISQEYKGGKSKVIAELKNPIICVSKYDVLSISTKGAFGKTYTREYEEGERVINVELYREIWNVADWKKISQSPTENYMLMTDLDFANEGNSIAISEVRGKINGNGYSISNLYLNNNALIINLYGTLENLYINNFTQNTASYGDLIGTGMAGSIVNNVHMNGVYITKTGSGYVGGIVRDSYTNLIKNSSVTNIEINTNIQNTPNSLYIGGIAGYISNSTIENCYVQGLKINDTKAVSVGVGGIIGNAGGTNSIKNCYSEGSIYSENINVGGIIGKIDGGNIENCYSKVNISTTNNNVGGIVGTLGSTEIDNISNNLSIGNIYTTQGINNLRRIAGDNLNTVNNNYAYEQQLLNGYVSQENIGATLLNKQEILNLNLGDSYNYDGKEKNVLPKLYNTEKTELLPNQKDITIDNSGEAQIELKIESVEATKLNTEEAEISIKINNPEEAEITGIEIEDMTGNITRTVTQNGITNIIVKATPTRYYDSYKLTKVKYKAKSSEEEQIKEVEAEIKVQFYKEIYTYEDWQGIEEGTYQNYRLMADIDFSGKDNIKNNITVNRLEAENNVYTLKNINLEFNNANVGLIQNVKTSMKNICFENITLKNTKGSGDYFGIISSNNGDLTNLRFKNITVEAIGMNNVGIIGGETSGNIKDIELENITVKGNTNIGGLIGSVNITVNTKIENITGDNITIEATGNYVGGIIGYRTGNNNEVSNISVNNSHITGQDYTGGIMGWNNSSSATYLEYFETNNTEVTGKSYVGGISGYLAGSAKKHMKIESCNITGTGNYIGGIAGRINGSTSYLLVESSTINAPSPNSQYIGGMAGGGNYAYITGFQVNNTNINSKGKYIGGIYGRNTNALSVANAYRGYINKVIIQGGSYVGGVIGYTTNSEVLDIYVNAQIKADSHTAGGIIGYLDNTEMTAASKVVRFNRTMVLDSTIEAPAKAGGLIGDIAAEIYRDQSFYYNNYIDAEIVVENEATGSLIIGGRPDENPYIKNTYVYKYSTLNGNYVYDTNDNIDNTQYLVRADIEQQSTFASKIGLGTSYWFYTSLKEGKYPKIADRYLYVPELQEGVELPTDPDISTLNNELSNIEEDDLVNNNSNDLNENGISAQSLEELPNVTVYPVSVNEINIDFSNIPENASFTYYVNGKKKETSKIKQKTYTFIYNYQDEIEIRVSNGKEEKSTIITPEDVKSEISLNGANKAYIKGTTLYINGEAQESEYVNIFEGYALNSIGQVLDIETMQVVETDAITNAIINAKNDSNANSSETHESTQNSSTAEETELKETAKPLHTYTYNENSIKTYGTYSTINDNIKAQIYTVKNGKLSALSNNLNMKIDNSITDSYNNKEYQTILTTEGEIIDLKEQLHYPENFLNRNIKQIEQNTVQEKTEMMVLYETGKAIVFNYVTGEIIYDNEEKADNGLLDYITGSISNIWTDYEEKQAEYAKSRELIAKLEDMPLEEVLNANNSNVNGSNTSDTTVDNNTNTNSSITDNTNFSGNRYITVYNGETEEYEVYSEKEILEGKEKEPISETTKIKINGLEGLYSYETEESKVQLNGAVIVISIIAASMVSLVILRKLVYVGITTRKKKNKKL